MSSFASGARYALLAILLPLLIRLIPEVMAGPYPIGFDTITAYIPITLDWSQGTPHLMSTLSGGWLLFVVLRLAFLTTNLDPIVLMKIVGPAIYGILGISEYSFARNVMQWSKGKSLTLVVAGSLYFVSLRISWDLYRDALGIGFLLIGLVSFRNINTTKRSALASIMALLVTATHVIVAALLYAIVAIEAIVHGDAAKWKKLACLSPAILLFSLSIFSLRGLGVNLIRPGAATGLPVYLYPLYIFLPMLPFAILGLRNLKQSIPISWLIVCFVGFVAGVNPGPQRWAILMSIPMTILTVETISQWWGRSFPRFYPRRILVCGWVIMLVFLSGSYLVLPSSSALPYYQFFAPTSMVQSTVPLSDSGSIVTAMRWLSSNIQPGMPVLTFDATYGWAKLYFNAPNTLVYFPGSSFESSFRQTVEGGMAHFYTIWWIGTYGWYGQPSVPPGFHLEQSFGHIGIFYYLGS